MLVAQAMMAVTVQARNMGNCGEMFSGAAKYTATGTRMVAPHAESIRMFMGDLPGRVKGACLGRRSRGAFWAPRRSIGAGRRQRRV